VALHGRDAAALSDVRAGINWDSPFQITLDLTNFCEIEDMRRHVERALEPIDILVANASGNTAKPVRVEDTSEQEWRAALNGNLTARALSGIGRCGLGSRNHPRRCGRRGDGVKINNGAAPRCSGSST
jgi:NADP-dependent 3-hydroxy acid dehydrogenase YdfG